MSCSCGWIGIEDHDTPRHRELVRRAGTPKVTVVCVKCQRALSHFDDPEDDEPRNWQDDVDGSSYCSADGGDHEETA